MSFQFSDRLTNEFYSQGFTVFRQISPPSLIADLRRVTDEGRAIARAKKGAQVQRFQPVGVYEIDQKPFQDYAELPALCDAISRVLSPAHVHGNPQIMGVLLEPQDLPYSTAWHRDARNLIEDEDEWHELFYHYDNGNQVNCPLWEDSCTWFVPGSHLRADLEQEKTAFPDFPPLPPVLENLSHEERERIGLEFCAQMPGAVCLHLNAGDFALYRPYGWHLGNYVPYKKRATLHDGVWLPESGERWMNRLKELQALRDEKKKTTDAENKI